MFHTNNTINTTRYNSELCASSNGLFSALTLLTIVESVEFTGGKTYPVNYHICANLTMSQVNVSFANAPSKQVNVVLYEEVITFITLVEAKCLIVGIALAVISYLLIQPIATNEVSTNLH